MTTLPQLHKGHIARDIRFTISKRITCNHNSRQRERLISTLVPGGIVLWCDHCRQPYVLPAEECIKFWDTHSHEISKHPLLLRPADHTLDARRC